MMRRRTILAMVLNLLVFPWGYYYLKAPRAFGVGAVVALILHPVFAFVLSA